MITVDAKAAGKGKVTCTVSTPDGAELDVDVVENHDGTFDIYYTAPEPGKYVITIRFGGEHIPNSPFHVLVSSVAARLAGGWEVGLAPEQQHRIPGCSRMKPLLSCHLHTWEVSTAWLWTLWGLINSLWRNLPCPSPTLRPTVSIHLPKVALQDDEALQGVNKAPKRPILPPREPRISGLGPFSEPAPGHSSWRVWPATPCALHALPPRRVTPCPTWRSPLTRCSCTGPAPTPHTGYCCLPHWARPCLPPPFLLSVPQEPGLGHGLGAIVGNRRELGWAGGSPSWAQPLFSRS